MLQQILTRFAALSCCVLISYSAMAQTNRSDIDDQYKWNPSELFPTNEAWKKAKNDLVAKIQKIVDYKDIIGRSATDMLNYFTLSTEISKDFYNLSVYVSMLTDVDLSNADNLALEKELEQVYIDYNMLSAFTHAELAQIPQETIDKFLAQEPELQTYAMTLNDIARYRQHTLSPVEEELLAKTDLLGNVPHTAYNIFNNAEMPFPTITLESGEEVELNQAGFIRLRASANRNDRQKAFEAFWNTYQKYEGTMGELMNGNIKQAYFQAVVRKFNTSLEASLHADNIPASVYHSLVENVNRCLPTFHRYLALKKRLLGVDSLRYSDIYAPTVKDVDLTYSYAEAQKIVLEALAPLGEEYTSVVQKAFDSRWIDVYPNKGKATGAYSNGAAYDNHPYILLNYQDKYEQVSTLAHELGHTMHSYFSNRTQPFAKAFYATFVAEVASTFNEALLNNYMLDKLTDKGQKISLLMNILDNFKGTLFRQTQFAEFELALHQKAENAEPITGKSISELYYDIVCRYYGHDKGVCYIDDYISHEWQFVDHFYMVFYVYQYSTAFVASQALSEMVLSGDEAARQRYLSFISAGGSKYPIDLLKDAGVDMTSPLPFDKAIEKMNKLMDEIEELLIEE